MILKQYLILIFRFKCFVVLAPYGAGVVSFLKYMDTNFNVVLTEVETSVGVIG